MAEEKKDNLTEEEIKENEDVEDQDDNKGDSGKSGKDDKSGKDKGGDDKGKSGKTFTQEQVNKMMTREKNQGRSAALKELGIDPKDSKMVAMVKALIESQKTDEQKAAEKDAENQTKMNEAEQRAQIAEAKAEAMMLGVKTQYVEDVVTLALAKMTEDSDLKTIIGEFKTKYPVWFGESEDDDKGGKNKEKGKTGQKGTGSSVKTSKEVKGEEKGFGARLAAQRRGTGKKSSYWGNNK
jgi:hypothetical protein